MAQNLSVNELAILAADACSVNPTVYSDNFKFVLFDRKQASKKQKEGSFQ